MVLMLPLTLNTVLMLPMTLDAVLRLPLKLDRHRAHVFR